MNEITQISNHPVDDPESVQESNQHLNNTALASRFEPLIKITRLRYEVNEMSGLIEFNFLLTYPFPSIPQSPTSRFNTVTQIYNKAFPL